MYNGETADDIAKRKGLGYREDILDNMESDELIANLFRISQTEQKLKKIMFKLKKKPIIEFYIILCYNNKCFNTLQLASCLY